MASPTRALCTRPHMCRTSRDILVLPSLELRWMDCVARPRRKDAGSDHGIASSPCIRTIARVNLGIPSTRDSASSAYQ